MTVTTINDLDELDGQTPSGYAVADEYFASQLRQGGRIVYAIDLSIPQLIQTIPCPDPDKVLEGNRRINLPQSRSFAEYLRKRPNWVCPPIFVRAPEAEFTFKRMKDIEGGAVLGVLSIPRLARGSLAILDGQHRVLGMNLFWDSLGHDLTAARQRVAEARKSGDAETLSHWELRRDEMIALRNRVADERVRIDIVIVDDPKDFKQIFFDIADNAKGISGSVKARFDSTKVVNRALDEVMRHRLLLGRVDEQSDRINRDSKFLYGAKHVADIVRAVQVGAVGRVSKRQEEELNDATVVREALGFLDLLVDSFPCLQEIVDENFTPAELRATTMLGSSTMLRVLAAVYHDLAGIGVQPKDATTPVTKSEIKQFFSQLEPLLAEIPVVSPSLWLDSSCFVEGANAPSARHGDIGKLSDFLIDWYRNGVPPTTNS